MTADRYLHHATEQRQRIREYNRMAQQFPWCANLYKREAKAALWRAGQYLMRCRIEREKMEAAE